MPNTICEGCGYDLESCVEDPACFAPADPLLPDLQTLIDTGPRRAVFQAINAVDGALRDATPARRESLHEVRDLLVRAFRLVDAPPPLYPDPTTEGYPVDDTDPVPF